MLVTTCFVTWSATTAASATVASPAHCHDARSERALGDREWRQPVCARADPHIRSSLWLVQPARRWSSMQSRAHGIARSRASPIGSPQLSQVPYVPSVDPRQRSVDLVDRLLCAFFEPLVELAVVGALRPCRRDGCRCRRCRSRRARPRAWRALVVQELDRIRKPGALVLEQLPELAGVDGTSRGLLSAAARSTRAAALSRPRSMPVEHERLVARRRPETISTASRAMPKRRRRAGGRPPRSPCHPRAARATRTFQPEPCRPTTPGREAPGATRSKSRVVTPRRLPPGEVPAVHGTSTLGSGSCSSSSSPGSTSAAVGRPGGNGGGSGARRSRPRPGRSARPSVKARAVSTAGRRSAAVRASSALGLRR